MCNCNESIIYHVFRITRCPRGNRRFRCLTTHRQAIHPERLPSRGNKNRAPLVACSACRINELSHTLHSRTLHILAKFSTFSKPHLWVCVHKENSLSRLRRKFESLNIESLLLDAGVETDQLMPKDEVSAKINLPPPVNASVTYVLCLLHYFITWLWQLHILAHHTSTWTSQ